jgi:hypothetical protein
MFVPGVVIQGPDDLASDQSAFGVQVIGARVATGSADAIFLNQQGADLILQQIQVIDVTAAMFVLVDNRFAEMANTQTSISETDVSNSSIDVSTEQYTDNLRVHAAFPCCAPAAISISLTPLCLFAQIPCLLYIHHIYLTQTVVLAAGAVVTIESMDVHDMNGIRAIISSFEFAEVDYGFFGDSSRIYGNNLATGWIVFEANGSGNMNIEGVAIEGNSGVRFVALADAGSFIVLEFVKIDDLVAEERAVSGGCDCGCGVYYELCLDLHQRT